MKKFSVPVSALSLFALLCACAHHRDVRPGAEGVHRVTLITDNTEEAGRDALSQASNYCEKMQGGKHPAIVSESKRYTGTMDESSYNNAKTAAKVAQGVGGAAYVFGGRNESNAGGIVGLGGAVADGAIGKGYTVEMTFKCQ